VSGILVPDGTLAGEGAGSGTAAGCAAWLGFDIATSDTGLLGVAVACGGVELEIVSRCIVSRGLPSAEMPDCFGPVTGVRPSAEAVCTLAICDVELNRGVNGGFRGVADSGAARDAVTGETGTDFVVRSLANRML
jgi:hypothetical protein